MHDIVTVGASAGGVEALERMAHNLSPELHAAVFVVLHVPDRGPSLLPDILTRAGALPAQHAHDGEKIEYGRIYVAPPGRHLVLKDGHMELDAGARVGLHTRLVSLHLFRSAGCAVISS